MAWLSVLHHKPFDIDALGLDAGLRVQVPGTPTPALDHIAWHTREVFQSPAVDDLNRVISGCRVLISADPGKCPMAGLDC